MEPGCKERMESSTLLMSKVFRAVYNTTTDNKSSTNVVVVVVKIVVNNIHIKHTPEYIY
jgi:hypothetical protein